MRRALVLLLLSFIVFVGFTGCKPERLSAIPPTAAVKAFSMEKHGTVRTDNYYWLRERENPEVIARCATG